MVWHTDIYNERSQAAIARLGATREGVLRKHRIRRDGSWRDTVQYSMTDDDWPAVARPADRAGSTPADRERSVSTPQADWTRCPRFSPATRAWFDGAFDAPTPAQVGAWDAIARGEHTLVVAPTGSGKTLAAFLSALDRLAAEPRPDDPKRRCRVLYVSPLKALAVDVERNLRSPLAGIRQAAARLGLPEPDVTVAMRSGDTPADERRGVRPPPGRHPDHHARVAVPAADLARPARRCAASRR